MLRSHNEVRRQAGVRPLAWSDRLTAQAQDWANTLLASGKFAHRPHSATGENLFEIRGASATPAEVVAAWAAEASDYDYGSNLCHGMCGHYTQLIWKTTKEVGCAVAKSGNREVWVCEYAPPGNYIGQRPY